MKARVVLLNLFCDGPRFSSLASVPGLARRDRGSVALEPEAPLIDLARAPSPYLKGHMSIGCPSACSYCDWGPRKMRYFDVARIESEFEPVLRHTSYIITSDADIFMDRKRALAVMEALLRASRGRPGVLGVETNPVHLWPEIADFVAQFPDRFYFALGLQSISPQVNKLIDRPFNLKALEARLGHFKRLFSNAKTHFSLIYGLPGDSLEGYERTLEWVLCYRPTRVALNQCLALPGSDLARNARKLGLEVEEGAPHRVLSTPTMTAVDVKKARRMSSLVLFVFCLPPLRELFLDFGAARPIRGILSLLNGWEKFLMDRGVRLEARGRFDRALEFPREPGELNAREFQRDPIRLAALIKATSLFLEEEAANRSAEELSRASVPRLAGTERSFAAEFS